jgi:hypothetical protein
MSTIATGTSSHLNTPRRSYITTTTFHNDIFAYTTSFSYTTLTTTGTLTSLATVGTATAANCKAGTVLRENGKKLYPPGMVTANSTTFNGAPNPGITTYMVGVYDPNTFLSGFIDPNSKLFAVYNSDKPEYVPRGINANGNAEIDQGAPVYTIGSITGNSVTATTTVTAGTGVVATAGQVRAATVTALTTITGTGAQTAQNLDATLGSVFTLTASPSGAASITLDVPTAAVVAGARIELLITATTLNALTITFGTNIVSNSTYAPVASAGPVTAFFAISFVCNGTQFFEISRTATQA